MKSLLLLAGLLAAVTAAQGQGTFDAVQSASSGSVNGYFAGTGGWTFTPQTDISVTSLGALDFVLQDNGTLDIGLWTDAGGLLAFGEVGLTNTPVNGSHYSSIAPVALSAGQTYRIGAYAVSGAGITFSIVSPGGSDGSVTLGPNINLGRAVNSTSGFGFPANLGAVNFMLLGANFQYNQTNIPEPSAIALLLLAGGFFAGCRRSKFCR